MQWLGRPPISPRRLRILRSTWRWRWRWRHCHCHCHCHCHGCRCTRRRQPAKARFAWRGAQIRSRRWKPPCRRCWCWRARPSTPLRCSKTSVASSLAWHPDSGLRQARLGAVRRWLFGTSRQMPRTLSLTSSQPPSLLSIPRLNRAKPRSWVSAGERDRLSHTQAAKPKWLGAICLRVSSGRRWRRGWGHCLRGLSAVGLVALSAACRLSDLFGRNGSLAYSLLLCQCHLDPFE